MIIWLGRLKTEIELSTIDVEYTALYQATRDELPFVIIMK